MSTKFEQLLDYLVNEETDKANELFHEIVVEKSRDIYESLIAEEEEEDKMEEASVEEDEAVEEASEDEDEEDAMEESYEEEAVESIFGEADDEEFPVQDQTDDMEADVAAPEMDGETGDEDSSAPADKGDIQDLEDALEELKAEFEALMAAEKNEEENEPGVHDDEEGESPLDSAEDKEEGEEEKKEGNPFAESKIARTQGEKMREYIEKVSQTMDGGLVGARTGETEPAPTEGKSPISSGSGKPTSGANAKNITQAEAGANEDGTSPKGKAGGLVKTGGDFVKAGTKNVASSANAKKPDGAKLTSVAKPSNKEAQ
jgi:hypothetical protein